jgi:murein DD-endopeptidase MepM/ murein hydrolase activator NlpD
MCHIKKILIEMVLLIFSSITMAEQVATSFIYPVGNQNSPPTEQTGNANGFKITQGFNTDPNIVGVHGGWCATTGLDPRPAYGNKSVCEGAGFKWIYGHTGVDLSAGGVCGGEIKAAANGKVMYSGNSNDGYGNKLKIRHTLPNGRIVYSLYGHRFSVEKTAGDDVLKGDVVGHVGSTGAGSNCHLHFAMFDQAMPLGGLDVPVGYVYNDKTGVTGNNNPITPNIIRYFYDPLLFVNDHNNDWGSVTGNAGYWYLLSASFDRSIPTRTMYVVNSTGVVKSLQAAVNAGWIGSNIYWENGTNWSYYPNQPIESNTLYSDKRYIIQTLTPNLTFHAFPPGNDYLNARWRGDMAEFTNVNSSWSFGRALRETYNNNSDWDTIYGLVTMTYEHPVNGYTHSDVYIAYSKTDPLVRYVRGYNPQTSSYSPWYRIY